MTILITLITSTMKWLDKSTTSYAILDFESDIENI